MTAEILILLAVIALEAVAIAYLCHRLAQEHWRADSWREQWRRECHRRQFLEPVPVDERNHWSRRVAEQVVRNAARRGLKIDN